MKSKSQNRNLNRKRAIAIGNFILLMVIFIACGGTGQKSGGNNASAKKITVTDVTGMQIDEAIKQLENAGALNITSDVADFADLEREKIIVKSQKPSGGTEITEDKEIKLECGGIYKLYLDLTSKSNLLLNKYDMDIYLDEVKLGTVSNGKNFTKLVEVAEGAHILEIHSAEKSSTKKVERIKVEKDITFSAVVYHDGSIGFDSNAITDGVAAAEMEMPDMVGRILSEAETELQNQGFLDVRGEPNFDIWDKNNWIVQKQNIEAGNLVEKNEHIQLECIHLNDYFEDNCLGKNIKEIQETAKAKGFEVRFVNKDQENLNSQVEGMSAEEKEEWTAIEVRQYLSAYNTALVVIGKEGLEEEAKENLEEASEETDIETSEEKKTESAKTKNDSVYFSTNNSKDAKNGDKGVYAYKKSGSYSIYYIIDMDKGYVYYFTDGNDEGSCMKVKIDSGTLNDVVIVTYHDGDDSWSQGLHFKWKNQAENLIVQEEDGFENAFRATDLDKALKLRDALKIIDY